MGKVAVLLIHDFPRTLCSSSGFYVFFLKQLYCYFFFFIITLINFKNSIIQTCGFTFIRITVCWMPVDRFVTIWPRRVSVHFLITVTVPIVANLNIWQYYIQGWKSESVNAILFPKSAIFFNHKSNEKKSTGSKINQESAKSESLILRIRNTKFIDLFLRIGILYWIYIIGRLCSFVFPYSCHQTEEIILKGTSFRCVKWQTWNKF